MRLIDADELRYHFYVQRTEEIIEYAGTQPVYKYTDVLAYDIDKAPTVKAIPIEWILNYVEHMTNIFGPMDIMTMLRRYESGFIPSVPGEKENAEVSD